MGSIIFIALALAFGVGLAVSRAQAKWPLREAARKVSEGDPRKSRAIARLFSSRVPEHRRAWLALLEANATLWEGDFSGALRQLDRRGDVGEAAMSVAAPIHSFRRGVA